MLDEGLRAGLAHLGIAHRTLCHVEREAHATAVLAARMEEGSLAPAPVWSDVSTFDAPAWHGRVDCIVAGFPCQDLSIAGRRAGLDGKRSGLFFEVVRIATDSGAWLMFLENVAGIATATASVVDQEEGQLDERAAARVVGELADIGWNAEWITLAAADLGASHGRARWFCLAWRVADTGHRARKDQPQLEPERGRAPDHRPSCESLDDTERHQRAGQRVHQGPGPAGPGATDAHRPGEPLVHADGAGWRGGRWGGVHHQGSATANAELSGAAMANASEHVGWEEQSARGDGIWRPGPEGSRERLADASQQRQPEPAGGEHARTHGEPQRSADALSVRDALPLFAPGPADPRWPAILASYPELAPALEPSFRRVVDGLAFHMDDSRSPRLKCIGNGVVALQAGLAFVELVRRARCAA